MHTTTHTHTHTHTPKPCTNKQRLVSKLRWMSDEVYAELFALAQCIPGPASTQVSFAVGTFKRGVPGGLLSGVLFQYPGAIIMTAVGVFAAKYLESPQGWLEGLTAGVSAVGVAMVASAGKAMAGKLCTGWLRAAICTAAVVISYYWPQAYTFPAVIVAGGLVTLLWSWLRKEPVAQAAVSWEKRGGGMRCVALCCVSLGAPAVYCPPACPLAHLPCAQTIRPSSL